MLHLDNFRISTESPRSCRPSACNHRCSRHEAITTNICSILCCFFYKLINLLRLQTNRVFGEAPLTYESGVPLLILYFHFNTLYFNLLYQPISISTRYQHATLQQNWLIFMTTFLSEILDGVWFNPIFVFQLISKQPVNLKQRTQCRGV